jgi:hypothetical protein
MVALRRRNGPAHDDSLTLRFPTGVTVVETPTLNPGIYDVTVRGGSAILAVNASSEWLPRPVKVRGGPIKSGTPVGSQPKLRDQLWIYALIIALLCIEWLFRRRIGMR